MATVTIDGRGEAVRLRDGEPLVVAAAHLVHARVPRDWVYGNA